MARAVGPKRRKFPWLAFLILLASIYGFWILPWQMNGQKKFVGPEAAPEVQANFVKPTEPPASKPEDENKDQQASPNAHP